MSRRQQRLGRAVVNLTVALILVVGAVLTLFVGASKMNVAADQPAVLQGEENLLCGVEHHCQWV